jgi:hypothetical protein
MAICPSVGKHESRKNRAGPDYQKKGRVGTSNKQGRNLNFWCNHHLCKFFQRFFFKILTIFPCQRQNFLQFFGSKDRISMYFQRSRQVFNYFSAPQANIFVIFRFKPFGSHCLVNFQPFGPHLGQFNISKQIFRYVSPAEEGRSGPRAGGHVPHVPLL